ncbi:virulence factor TspB C-terminal domain-related protein [Stenotrophomonas sp. GD03654]|uniref:virulence factor TspB C-terminal domain-related protein n=1 Tax=Stenotrophomonas TaxID=40323 RepID=UPI0013DA8322|nr:virulence factor TspB C-terminal domain-related protein [Stenotrophomonas sp. GD03654]MDH2178252.1 virulence factor TspB C-terminal domain-related protein [Stenotrophomonas sp. GD03654]
MRWIARILAVSIARRVAYVLVALLALWLGIGKAGAQEKDCRFENARCTPGEAQSQCNASGTGANASIPGGVTRRECRFETVGAANEGRIHLWYWGKNSAGSEVGPFIAGPWYWRNTCATQPSKTTPFFPPSGSVRCIDACEVTYRPNADDTSTYSPNGKVCDKKPDCAAQGRNMVWNAMLGVCQPVEPECPQGKVKVGNTCSDEKPCPDGMALVAGSCKKEDNECPAGMIRSPLGSCIPGDGQCAKGEVRGPDGTCKRDKDSDGQPDTDDPESFSGGDTCTSPPSCSGSPIMCGQARIQWRIDCNTRRNNNISGGHCSQSGMPICTGEECKAMEYSQLLMQWRSACAVEKLAAKQDTPGQGGNQGDANGNGVADVLEGRGDVTPIGDGTADVASAKKWGIGLSTSNLDTSNMFGGGGTCPEPPAITIMGKTVNSADFPYFCRIAAILRALILIFGAYTAIRILMGAAF